MSEGKMAVIGLPESKLEFDVWRASAQDLADIRAANISGNLKKLAKLLAKFCISTPAGWGEPNDPKTFETLSQPRMLHVRKVWQDATTAAVDTVGDEIEVPDGFEYDLEQVMAADIMQLASKARNDDVSACAQLLAKIITKTPTGNPASAKTYLGLSYYRTYYPLLVGLLQDASDSEKNARSGSRY